MSIKKSIKTMIRKQLKSIPNWSRLQKKVKRELCSKVMNEVIQRFYKNGHVEHDRYENLQLTSLPAGVMSLGEMNEFTAHLTTRITPLPDHDKSWYLSYELRAIDNLLDDTVLNALLAPTGYTPSKREKTPAMFFRAELLKSLYYAEMSYRKFCELEVNDLERKRNRTFIGLDRRRLERIHHSELSSFRSQLTWKQQLNLLVYILTQFFASPAGQGSFYYSIDGTDLAAKMVSHPVATVTVTIAGREENISVYSQIDTECGERRAKSDRSTFFVGYKVHTLAVLNPLTGKAYPLLPLVTGANHHDNNFLEPLVTLGKALGLDLRLIVADQAYDNAGLADFPELTMVTQPRTTVCLPDNVESPNGLNGSTTVFCHQFCETPMTWVGRDESVHEYHCSADSADCPFLLTCPRQREIPVDNGLFGHIPRTENWVANIENTRKHAERPFNLIKHRNGSERITVKSQQAAQVVLTTATIAVLLLEMVRLKHGTKEGKKQIEIPLLAS